MNYHQDDLTGFVADRLANTLGKGHGFKLPSLAKGITAELAKLTAGAIACCAIGILIASFGIRLVAGGDAADLVLSRVAESAGIVVHLNAGATE